MKFKKYQIKNLPRFTISWKLFLIIRAVTQDSKDCMVCSRRQEGRDESYGKQRGEPWVELNVKGCDDHICNLVSKELEKRLCIRWSNWGFGGDGKRHPASGAVIHMTKRLTSHFRRAFKAFLRENGIKPFGMTRISETRFCTHLWNNPTKQEMLHNIDI